MTEKEISAFYKGLKCREKGKFLLYIANRTSRSVRTWQMYLSRLERGEYVARTSALELEFIHETIVNGTWL